MIQAHKLPLFTIVLALSNFALLAPVKAVDPTDTFYGTGAGNGTTTGTADSAFGYDALSSLISGDANTAIGTEALYRNTTGDGNTATGDGVLQNNETGNFNTASGTGAMFNNVIGSANTASGYLALYNNNANANTASGAYSLFFNSTGIGNTASGASSLFSNTTGVQNMANGENALYSNTTANYNTASGNYALYSNTTGANNIALGYRAGFNITTGSGNIEIGNTGDATDNNTTRIGPPGQSKCFIAGIYGALPTGNTPTQVYIDSNGQLGAKPSSRRFKHEIKPMDTVSEAILSFKPVTFQYKGDQTNTAQFGLIAEEVEKVNPDLVVRDKDGKTYSVRYDAVDAMLLNEFLKEHRKVEQLTKDFQSKLAEQQKQIEELTAGLQKVSAQLELSKPAPQTLANNQ